MATNTGTPRLPVKKLFDANPTWLRGSDDELGDMADLRASMMGNWESLKVPVLVKPDYLVLDGARRIVVASDLGWKEIPVVVAHDWDDAYNRFLATRKAEKDGLPFLPLGRDILSTGRLIAHLKVLYAPKREQLIRESRIKNREAGIKPVKDRSVSLFDRNLCTMLDIEPSTLKAYRNIFSSLRSCYDISKALGEEAEGHIRDYVENGGQLWVLRDLIKELKDGVRTTRAVRSLRPDSAPIETQRVPIPVDPAKAKQQISAVSQIVQVLEDMGRLVSELEPFNPAADVEVIKTLQERRRAALGRVNRLRNLLETPIKAKESENEK